MKTPLPLLGALVFAALALAVPATTAGAQATDGKTLYEANCRKCHGALGVPPKAMKAKFPKLEAFDAAFVAKHSTDDVVKALTKGTSEDMKSFKDKLTAEQMAAVATYVHDLAAAKSP